MLLCRCTSALLFHGDAEETKEKVKTDPKVKELQLKILLESPSSVSFLAFTTLNMTNAEVLYNQIAAAYKQSKWLPFRQSEIQTHTALLTQHQVKEKVVLDLACGDGFYSRILKYQLGARLVIAVDISERMVHLAREQPCEGIIYIQADVCHLPEHVETIQEILQTHGIACQDGKPMFDVVTAAYLLNYAQSRQELQRYIEAIDLYLSPGGVFVTINDNPEDDVKLYASLNTRPLGIVKSTRLRGTERCEGDPVIFTLYNDAEDDTTAFEITNYWIPKKTIEDVFVKDVGFLSVEWCPLNVDQVLSAEQKMTPQVRQAWLNFKHNCPLVCLVARK